MSDEPNEAPLNPGPRVGEPAPRARPEAFASRLRAARHAEGLGEETDQAIIDLYESAAEADPSRAEALHDASRFCRGRGRFEDAYRLARRGLDIGAPGDGSNPEAWIHDFGLLDELAVAAYWTGHYRESVTACNQLLREGKMPPEMTGRIVANRQFALDKLPAEAEARPAETQASPAETQAPPAETETPPAKARALPPASQLVPAERAAPAKPARRCAVVTPYFDEDRAVLTRCIDSVTRQTVPVEHIVVADGRAQDWVSEAGVRHLVLDRTHEDFGATPRAIGALLAVAEGYDAIALLDADTWLEPDHLAHCLAAADAAPDGACDYVIARSRHVGRDGSTTNRAAETSDEHVDTSCLVFLKGAFQTLPLWATMPKEAAPVGDRVFHQALRAMRLRGVATDDATVAREATAEVDRPLGETPPRAKANIPPEVVATWAARLADDLTAALARWLRPEPERAE